MRTIASFLALLICLAAAGSQVATARADAWNTRNVLQQQMETAGGAAGAGAVSGPVMTFNMETVPQINVQVIAGDQATQDNSTQTATNTLNLNQTSAAASGDASTDGTGTATTGPAIAGNIVTGYQLNVQVIAGIGCDVDQVASNTLDLDQQAAAVSGDATASDGGSGGSGAATAINRAHVGQRNVQVYVCRNGSTGLQVAENLVDYEQIAVAASGAATGNAGSASTGDDSSLNDLRSRQSNRQIVID
jgi:hypothetical protein